MNGLSHRWTQETKLCLGDLFADETFLSRNLPKIKPMYPVLSTQEHDIVYLVVGGVKAVGNHQVKGVKHLLSVNTRHNKVLSASSYKGVMWPQLFASDFNLYLQGYQRKQLIRAMKESQRKVHQIKQAYEVLSDTSKRAMYDADLSAAAMLGCAQDGSANVDAMKQDTNHTNSTSLAT
ncbi:unnamed protein product [Urochloa humidicola]